MTADRERGEPATGEAGEDDAGAEAGTLTVFRCDACGDTFPAHEQPVCPSCGASDVHPAQEPLL